MRKKKLLVVSSARHSPWWSCQTIAPNLREAYRRACRDELEVEFFEYSTSSNRQPLYREEVKADFIAAVRRSKADELVFTDDSPHPGEFLKILCEEGEKETTLSDFFANSGIGVKPLTFHVYGDFTYRSTQWLEAGSRRYLLDLPVRLICASPRQTALVRGFLRKPTENALQCVPFAVDCEKWAYRDELRKAARQERKLSNDTRVILYTGRISLQKNVTRLIEEFAKLVKSGRKKNLLWIAGPYDDQDGALMAMESPLGYVYQKVQKVIQSLPKEVVSRIRLFEPLRGKDLLKLYCAADVFASLSLYHDEDFGMSPAEALATGLPVVLSDWAGYSGFSVPGTAFWKASVTLDSEGLSLSSKEIQSGLSSALELADDGARRRKRGAAFAEYFSISSIGKRLSQAFDHAPPPFGGFNSKLSYLSDIVHVRHADRDFYPRAGGFYEEIYQPYIGADESSVL